MKTALFVVLSLVAFPALAAVSMSMGGLVDLVVYLIVIGVIFGLLWFLVDRAPFIPEPFKSWIKYVVLFFAVLFLINWLLGVAGHPLVSFR